MSEFYRPVVARPDLLECVRAQARAAAPREACGLLLGQVEAARIVLRICVPSRNLAADPVRRFEVDPAVRFRAQRAARYGGEPLVGVYHSHPVSIAVPSATDRRCLVEPGLVWLITGPAPRWEIRTWWALRDDFRELSLVVREAGSFTNP